MTLDIILAIIVAVNLLINITLVFMYVCEQKRGRMRRKEEKRDEVVEREMKRDFLDEGFENLMAYSVRGENGFGDKTV
jgi:hypothetical protein